MRRLWREDTHMRSTRAANNMQQPECRDILHRLSERLLEKEVIEGDELRELVGPLAPVPDAV